MNWYCPLPYIGDISVRIDLLAVLEYLHLVLYAGRLRVSVCHPRPGLGQVLVVVQLRCWFTFLRTQHGHHGFKVCAAILKFDGRAHGRKSANQTKQGQGGKHGARRKTYTTSSAEEPKRTNENGLAAAERFRWAGRLRVTGSKEGERPPEPPNLHTHREREMERKKERERGKERIIEDRYHLIPRAVGGQSRWSATQGRSHTDRQSVSCLRLQKPVLLDQQLILPVQYTVKSGP